MNLQEQLTILSERYLREEIGLAELERAFLPLLPAAVSAGTAPAVRAFATDLDALLVDIDLGEADAHDLQERLRAFVGSAACSRYGSYAAA